VTESPT